jgi:hypothetical protein
VISNLDAVCGYQSALARDAAGNLLGVCDQGPGADGYGWVFELTNCSQTCTVIDLHDFTAGSATARVRWVLRCWTRTAISMAQQPREWGAVTVATVVVARSGRSRAWLIAIN